MNGRKTYVVAACVVALGVYQFLVNDMPPAEAVEYVLGGSALAAVRSALAKLEV